MNMYDDYHFWGMHVIWWFVWLVLLFWIFATPYDIPYQRGKKSSPLDILQRRFAAGQITKENYLEHRAILEKDNAVEDFRKLIGATDPAKAEKGTIRNLFAESIGANAIHGSDSAENARIEGDFFFSDLEKF